MHFERRAPGLDAELLGEHRRDQHRCDLLANLDDAQAEEIFDQRKDRPAMTMQQSADRRKRPVDVVLGPAHRKLAPSICRKPLARPTILRRG